MGLVGGAIVLAFSLIFLMRQLQSPSADPNTGIPAFTACIILRLVTRIWRTFASTAATARTRIIENLFRTLERLLLVKSGVFFFPVVSIEG